MVSIHYKTNLKAMSRWCLFTHLLEVAFPELVCSDTININVECDSDTRHFISPIIGLFSISCKYAKQDQAFQTVD